MAVKYDYRNQNKGNQWFIMNFDTQGAFHETENIYNFIVSSFVKRSPDIRIWWSVLKFSKCYT